ncbi:hypothetical protein GPECTOR_39g415 [Gonium pectorale]|uniref:Uncharacterized protein n=1 Tax=Gonium pectorale TaxID=33097 RepID=A0A150GAP6_GONPE|nr:hypothetical protein GPECTOR_39g415 [Gonium pectorale]|eukprot:KXZ46921.1 hypothetical protein GPECTOR_39g415 [Gonium pectorale]
MDRVQQIMVRSQSAPVRTSCGVALLQFLLDFPLGPQRLKQHVAFLLANLEYEYESGRLQVLDMLAQVVAKFPAEVLQAQSDVLLMPLVVRLVNDSSPKARAAAGEVLRSLLGRLEPPQLDRAVGYCRAWLGRTGGGTDAALRRAAAQTLGFVAEAEGGRFGRRMAELAPAVLRVLEQQAARGADGDDSDPALDDESAASEEACPGWHEAYYCLLLLEKLVAQSAAALAWPTGQSAKTAAAATAGTAAGGSQPVSPLVPELWEATVRLLLHRHVWVRKAAARLVGHGLASPRVSGGLMAARPGRAGELAFSFFLQLECDQADEPTCLQAVKCLVSLSVHLHREHAAADAKRQRAAAEGPAGAAANGSAAAVNGGHQHADGEEADHEDAEADGDADGNDEPDGDDEAAEAKAEADDEEAVDGAGEDAGDDEGDAVSMAAQVARRAFTLRGLVRRMARLADDARWGRGRQRSAALRWTAAAASALGADAIAPHLPVLLRPLELLLASYNKAREHVKGMRSERKRRSAVRGMLDPAAAAAARLRHNARKAEGRKRKLEVLKRERSARQLSGGGRPRGGGGAKRGRS